MFQKKQPPNADFKSRVQAYEAARKKGVAFQAEGTVGGIPLRKRRRARNTGRLFALILVVAVAFFTKAVLFSYVGPDAYRAKLAPYAASRAPQDQAIAFVMQADPVTLWVAKLFVDAKLQAVILRDRYLPAALRP